MKYSDFVDYKKLDPFKKKVVEFLSPTFKNLNLLNIRLVKQSLGEPAVLFDFLDYDFLLAFKSDGVGTKNKIADKMLEKNKSLAKKLYSGIGIDLIAMNANDLVCLGARPVALSDEVASGDSSWFEKKDLVEGLLSGFKAGCHKAGVTISCGETPILKDIIYPDSVNITGSMIGIIKPKTQAILGEDLKAGDRIYGFLSSGIHSNGLTLARKIVEKLKAGYFYKFKGRFIGEELLTPTQIYVKPILELIDKGVEVHYLSNITGSGFKKIMRAKKPFTYVMDNLPKKPELFSFLQEKGHVSDKQAYQTWNMGVGMVLMASEKQEAEIKKIFSKYKIKTYNLGYLKKGEKKVIIKPLNIEYKEN
jgi:phosphoribosylformylglycinamidine cyclo-ligase